MTTSTTEPASATEPASTNEPASTTEPAGGYVPRPVVTDGIELPPELGELIERLAASNHDNWALQRMSDGWTFGPKRDDDLKTHPGLVEYGELSEVEKEYDRITVIETIKAIVALGYEIRRG